MADQQEFIGLLENWANIYMFRSLSEYFDFLKTAGISIQQAFVLTFLFYNGPSKVAEICEHMMGTTAAASQMVKRLESQDFVIRTIDSADRRVRNVLLTEAGRIGFESSDLISTLLSSMRSPGSSNNLPRLFKSKFQKKTPKQ